MKSIKKKVLVFGVFDKFHDGHKDFLLQAKKLGDELIVVVARDEMVFSLKKKMPSHSLKLRLEKIKSDGVGDTVIAGDKKPGQWNVIKKVKPSIIALGYDQGALETALREKIQNVRFEFQIVKLKPHKSHIFHTSLLG